MDTNKIQEKIQMYINKYKELEDAKRDLQDQKEQVTKQLVNIEQNMIYIQGAVKALQQLLEPIDDSNITEDAE